MLGRHSDMLRRNMSEHQAFLKADCSETSSIRYLTRIIYKQIKSICDCSHIFVTTCLFQSAAYPFGNM